MSESPTGPLGRPLDVFEKLERAKREENLGDLSRGAARLTRLKERDGEKKVNFSAGYVSRNEKLGWYKQIPENLRSWANRLRNPSSVETKAIVNEKGEIGEPSLEYMIRRSSDQKDGPFEMIWWDELQGALDVASFPLELNQGDRIQLGQSDNDKAASVFRVDGIADIVAPNKSQGKMAIIRRISPKEQLEMAPNDRTFVLEVPIVDSGNKSVLAKKLGD